MIDLHQGITGEELKDARTGVGDLAMAQLDAWSALLRGDVKAGLAKQLGVYKLVGKIAFEGARAKLGAGSKS